MEISNNPSELNNQRLKMLWWREVFYKLASIALCGLILWSIGKICAILSEVVTIIGLALLASYMLSGAVDWLQYKTPIKQRGLSVLILFLALALALSLFGFFVFPNLTTQLQSLSHQMPDYLNQLNAWLSEIGHNNGFVDFDWMQVSQSLSTSFDTFAKEAFDKFIAIAFNTISFVIAALATIVLTIYLLLDAPAIWKLITRPLNQKYQAHAERLREGLSRTMRAYLIGQVQLASLSGIFVFFMYMIMQSKYALLLGIWQSIIEIIPVVGGILGIGLGVLVLLFNDPIKALIAFVLYMIYTQIFKDNFLTPRIMSNAVGLHPVIVLLVVLVGAKVGGVAGVIFALPVAAMVNTLIDYYLELVEQKDITQYIPKTTLSDTISDQQTAEQQTAEQQTTHQQTTHQSKDI
ncbi:MAG: AI-2E family transporter [Candidatus Caenarcaniphilales bacterium]|nr:AI-2E family transporter [Candidatus Caenarcaniphilales bacterium]